MIGRPNILRFIIRHTQYLVINLGRWEVIGKALVMFLPGRKNYGQERAKNAGGQKKLANLTRQKKECLISPKPFDF